MAVKKQDAVKPPKPAKTKHSREEREIAKLSARLSELSSEIKEMRKGIITPERIKKIEEGLYAGMRELKSELRESVRQAAGDAGKALDRLSSVESDIFELRKLESHIQKVDITGTRRDIESLDAKHKWLESRVERIDMDGLVEKISELEVLVKSMRAASPIVIE